MAVEDQNTLEGTKFFTRKLYCCIHPPQNKAHLFDASILMQSLFYTNIYVTRFENDSKNQKEKLLQIRKLNCDSSRIFEMPKQENLGI